MRTQQTTKNNSIHQRVVLLFCMCAFSFRSGSSVRRSTFCTFLVRKLERTNGILPRALPQPPQGEVDDDQGNDWRNRDSTRYAFPLFLLFVYSGPAVTVKNGRLQIGFVGGAESCLQQEDRLAYRDHTHHREPDIGGSRLLRCRSSNHTTPPSIFVTQSNEHTIGRRRGDMDVGSFRKVSSGQRSLAALINKNALVSFRSFCRHRTYFLKRDFDAGSTTRVQ